MGVFWKTFSSSSAEPWGSIHGPEDNSITGKGYQELRSPVC